MPQYAPLDPRIPDLSNYPKSWVNQRVDSSEHASTDDTEVVHIKGQCIITDLVITIAPVIKAAAAWTPNSSPAPAFKDTYVMLGSMNDATSLTDLRDITVDGSSRDHASVSFFAASGLAGNTWENGTSDGSGAYYSKGLGHISGINMYCPYAGLVKLNISHEVEKYQTLAVAVGFHVLDQGGVEIDK